jgi:hypothetical protein
MQKALAIPAATVLSLWAHCLSLLAHSVAGLQPSDSPGLSLVLHHLPNRGPNCVPIRITNPESLKNRITNPESQSSLFALATPN